ncbi:MAG: hypothetical protein KAX38_07745, partial [Candidatus Krumholzibacteria bacterium]|nr:hypothetical protein [Candidatus Krumholzibacteria bacterium]
VEVGMITEQEFEEVRRRESYFSKGLRVGYLWPFSSMGGAERLLVLDFAYQYDTRDFFLSGRSGLRWGGDLDEDHGRAVDVVLLDAKIGRYFNGGDFSPFVSAGIGIHWVKAEERIEVERGRFEENEDSGTGLALIAGGGFTAFKTYNFQFQLDIDYFIILEKLDVGGYPKGIIFTFCIRKGQKRD